VKEKECCRRVVNVERGKWRNRNKISSFFKVFMDEVKREREETVREERKREKGERERKKREKKMS
jgi:hypothetical protein